MSARSLLLLWLGSLGSIGAAAALFSQPGYMDAYYYYHVAANLAAGRPLVEDFVWNYLLPVDAIPHPSNLYWMPLTSLVAAPFLALFGPGFRAAQASLVLVASLVPPFTAWMVWDLWRDRGLALAAAALTLFGGFYLLSWTSVDSFGSYALAVTAGLWAAARFFATSSFGVSTDTTQSLSQLCFAGLLGAIAGAAAGAAHLARADGILLLPTVLMAFILSRRQSGLMACAVALASYGLVMGPWLFRVWALTGSITPPGAFTSVFFQSYNDLFSYDQNHSLASYLSWGLGPILTSKLRAFAENLVVLYGSGFMLVPFGLLGGWLLRQDRRILPFFLYAGLLYAFLTLVFTFPGARGSMRHSAAALLPWTAVLAVHGLRAAVAWAALRLPHWQVRRAQLNFIVVAVAASLTLSLIMLFYNAGVWDEELYRYQEVATWLDAQRAGPAPIMVTDPPGFFYASGRQAIATPSNGPLALLAAADRFGVEHVALEAAHAPALDPLYRGTETTPRLESLGWVRDIRMFKVLR